jgi:hypothetical protein
MPGVTSKVLGTHHALRFSGTHVIHGGASDAENPLMFRTDDLPEGKPIQTMVDLTQPLSEEQMTFVSKYSVPKTIVVTCATVEVVEISSAQTGKTARMAHGKQCVLESLK